MTDGPATQSVFLNNYGSGSIFVGVSGTTRPNRITYSGNNGSTGTYFVSQSSNSSGSVAHFPQYPSQIGFPISTTGLTSYTIQAGYAGGTLGASIRFELDCIQKYPNVRIKFKNRFIKCQKNKTFLYYISLKKALA